MPKKDLENECPIRYYGGTVAELTALGWTVSSYTAGTTELTSISMEGYWYLLTDGSSKAGYLYSLIRGYIVDKNKPLAGATNVTLHELGHALGWRGHSAVSSDIMYSLSSSISLLTNRDKDHLSQVY